MTFSYDNGTKTWSIQLDAKEEGIWARYRARLKELRHEPISNNEAMKILVSDAWKAARQWTRMATQEAKQRAFENADAATQAAAQDAAEAALMAAIGFNPEA